MDTKEFREEYCSTCKLAKERGCDIEKEVDNYYDPDATCLNVKNREPFI